MVQSLSIPKLFFFLRGFLLVLFFYGGPSRRHTRASPVRLVAASDHLHFNECFRWFVLPFCLLVCWFFPPSSLLKREVFLDVFP